MNSFNSSKKYIYIYINNPIKNGQRTQIDNFQRRYTNGQQVHEKVLNITNHWGNANQNHNEISTHIC